VRGGVGVPVDDIHLAKATDQELCQVAHRGESDGILEPEVIQQVPKNGTHKRLPGRPQTLCLILVPWVVVWLPLLTTTW